MTWFKIKMPVTALGILSLSFMCLTYNVQAQSQPANTVGYEAASETEVASVPNLTVNFSLNSVADPETTQYYTQIVEEMLRNLPRKVSLTGDPASLVQTEPVYDHLKVVSYLPKANTDPNGLAEKDIRYFTVEFEVPEGLVNLIEVEDLPPGVESQSIVVHKGKYEDFVDILYNDGSELETTPQTPEVGLQKAGMTMDDIMGKKPKSEIGMMVEDTAKAQMEKDRIMRKGPTKLMQEMAALEISKKAGKKPATAAPVTTAEAKPSKPKASKTPLNLKGVTITFNKGVDVGGKLKPLAASGSEKRRLQMIAFVTPVGSETITDVANQRFLSAENELKAAGMPVSKMLRSRIILQSAETKDKLNITLK